MTHTVTGEAARPVSYGMFAGIPDIPEVRSFGRDGAATVVTFAGELTPEQAQAVWDRMTSRDDADQARRAELAAQLPDADPIVAGLIRYVLGLPDEPVADAPTPDAPT